jgi:protein TonB
VLVSREGLPIDVAIVATSGFNELDAAAAAGIRHWRFVPATRDREPIDARIRVPVRFRLTADGR